MLLTIVDVTFAIVVAFAIDAVVEIIGPDNAIDIIIIVIVPVAIIVCVVIVTVIAVTHQQDKHLYTHCSIKKNTERKKESSVFPRVDSLSDVT